MVKNNYANQDMIPKKDMKFPVVFFESFLRASQELQLHYHNDLEIVEITKGEVLYTINGYKTLAKVGDIVFINHGQVHQAVVQDCDEVEMKVLMINYNFIKSQMMDIVNEDYIIPLMNQKFIFHNIVTDDLVKKLFLEISEIIISKPKHYTLKVKSLFLDMLIVLFDNDLYYSNLAYKRKNELDSNDVTRQTIEYIHSHYHDQMSLDNISDSLMVSKFHLCRLFKKTTDITINTYINNYRLAQAARMISDTKKNITTIAFDCGYNNPSYFISKFKTQYGVSPNQYKKISKEKH